MMTAIKTARALEHRGVLSEGPITEETHDLDAEVNINSMMSVQIDRSGYSLTIERDCGSFDIFPPTKSMTKLVSQINAQN